MPRMSVCLLCAGVSRDWQNAAVGLYLKLLKLIKCFPPLAAEKSQGYKDIKLKANTF